LKIRQPQYTLPKPGKTEQEVVKNRKGMKRHSLYLKTKGARIKEVEGERGTPNYSSPLSSKKEERKDQEELQPVEAKGGIIAPNCKTTNPE